MQKFLPFLSLLFFPLSTFAQTFTDVDENFPHYESIEWAVEENIVQGFEDGTFKPNQEVTRAEFLKLVLLRKYTEEEIENGYIPAAIFSDVSLDDWFNKYVLFAHQEGIINGYEDGNFKPYNSISFAESAKIMVTTLTGNTVKQNKNEKWFIEYIRLLNENHNIYGHTHEKVKRGEIVEFLMMIGYMYLENKYYLKDNGVYYRDNFYQRGKYIKLKGLDVNQLSTYKSSYFITSESVFITDKKSVFIEDKKIKDIDAKTFELIEGPYIKDKDYIYLLDKRLINLDVNTFEVIQRNGDHMGSPRYSKDKNNVYRIGVNKSYNLKLEIVKDADPETFEVILSGCYEGCWGDITIDKNNYYQGGEVVKSLDKNTTKIFQNGIEVNTVQPLNFIKGIFVLVDEDTIFLDQEVITHTFDFASLNILESRFYPSGIQILAKDKNGLYMYTQRYEVDIQEITKKITDFYSNFVNVTSTIDKDSLEFLEWGYYKDKNYFYYSDLSTVDGDIFKKIDIENTDEKSLEYLKRGYFKDFKSYYLEKNNMLEVVPKSEVPSELLQE